MIGLDTNIIVRYLVRDDPIQTEKAVGLLERGLRGLTEHNPGFVSVVVIVETAWVIKRVYGFADAEVATAIERLLEADNVIVENEQAVFAAMRALKERRGSFADALIGNISSQVGCSHTLTFDRKALRLPGFTLLE
jgi:predicted nucleic-acid-binding protein